MPIENILILIGVAGLYVLGFAMMGFMDKGRESSLPERYR